MSAANWPPHAPVLAIEIDEGGLFVTMPSGPPSKTWKAAYDQWRALTRRERLESFLFGTAATKFRKGDRVRLSLAGEEHFRVNPPKVQTGIVTGFPRNIFLVHVRLDGDKAGASWHMDFWNAPHPPAGAIIRRASLESV